MAGNTLTSSLVVRLLDQVSAPAKKVGGALLGLDRSARQAANGFGGRLNIAAERNSRSLEVARGGMIDAIAAFIALKNAICGPVREAMADVKKVVDFPTPEALQEFEKGLIDLSKRVPLSVNGLAQIAAAAGQAGIAGADLNRFTEAAAKVGVAFDISADKAGEAMAKLMTGLGLSIDEAVLLTDSMNHLSNAQASSAAEILDVVRRVGAQSKQFGFSATQVSAFASAMISAGAESEVAARRCSCRVRRPTSRRSPVPSTPRRSSRLMLTAISTSRSVMTTIRSKDLAVSCGQESLSTDTRSTLSVRVGGR